MMNVVGRVVLNDCFKTDSVVLTGDTARENDKCETPCTNTTKTCFPEFQYIGKAQRNYPTIYIAVLPIAADHSRTGGETTLRQHVDLTKIADKTLSSVLSIGDIRLLVPLQDVVAQQQ